MGLALMGNRGHGGLFKECCIPAHYDSSEWLFCSDIDMYRGKSCTESTSTKVQIRSRRRGAGKTERCTEAEARRLEELTRELFKLHDLNDDGALDELELIKLNQKIAILHYGRDVDMVAVTDKYRGLFRAKLDPEGRPVPYERFRIYAKELLDGLDGDPEAQEMIMEQFVAEAQSGRQAFGFASQLSEEDSVPAEAIQEQQQLPDLLGTLRTPVPSATEQVSEASTEDAQSGRPNVRAGSLLVEQRSVRKADEQEIEEDNNVRQLRD